VANGDLGEERVQADVHPSYGFMHFRKYAENQQVNRLSFHILKDFLSDITTPILISLSWNIHF
jgi:hypothetical protein